MINGIKKSTIVSTTEDRLTLLNWLKKLEKTLSDDTLTDIAFTDDGGNVSLVLTFEDGTTKSVAFPYDMSAFAKKSGQAFTGAITAPSIIEDMRGYTISNQNTKATFNYAGVVKNGNKLTIALFLNIQLTEDLGVNLPITICHVNLPLAVANKLTTTTIEGVSNIVNNQKQIINYSLSGMQEANLITYRYGQTLVFNLSPLATPMLASRNYLMRIEVTFLLSDNLAS